MPDVEKILKMVEQGALTAAEADQILATLSTDRPPATDKPSGSGWTNRASARDAARTSPTTCAWRSPKVVVGWSTCGSR